MLLKKFLSWLLPGMVLMVTPMPATPTPMVVVSPIQDERLGYVQQELIASGFPESQVNLLLEDTRRELYPQRVVAYKEPNWVPIRRKLYSAAYVQEGTAFIAAHHDVFARAETEFGVPVGVITGIIAIETEFGRNTGTTPTFNAIYSRLQYRAEKSWDLEAQRLIALSTYCLQSNLDCYNIRGSYAGAMGIVQFMPDSLMKYGVDGTGDGFVDLQNPDDAIVSAAKFLQQHGWAEDQLRALARYYGRTEGYPEIVLHYASLLEE